MALLADTYPCDKELFYDLSLAHCAKVCLQKRFLLASAKLARQMQ
jgi:hypothetical protein